MANYKTLDGLDLDIGGFTDSVTRSKQTLEDVARKSRGIGTKPETEEIELDSNFLKGIAQLFKDNGYEPEQPSENNTATIKDKVLDEYVELIKSDSIQDAMKKVSTLGESPNKVEDIYTAMDTDFVTLENQPSVDSEGDTLEIEQTESKGLMSRPSGETQVDESKRPEDIDIPKVGTEKVSVDSKVLSPAFLNAIGITGSLTEEGVQNEVKKVLKEQGMSDEEITSLVDKSIGADEVQPTDGKEIDLSKELDTILVSEGGFQQDKDDSGNYVNGVLIGTNRGVTPSALAKHRGVKASTITVEDIKNLTEEEVREIFKNEYFYKPKINKLPLELQSSVLDMQINSGPNAIKILQKLVGTKQDGIIGPITLKALKDNPVTVNEYADARIEYYKKVIKKSPEKKKFLSGWTNRANSYRE